MMKRLAAAAALTLALMALPSGAADIRLKDFPVCSAVASTTSIYVDRGIGATSSERATPAQVCQAGATTTPAAGVVPKADGAGLLPAGFLPAATTSVAGACRLATTSSDTTAGRCVQASDDRLSDARTPVAHGGSAHTGNIFPAADTGEAVNGGWIDFSANSLGGHPIAGWRRLAVDPGTGELSVENSFSTYVSLENHVPLPVAEGGLNLTAATDDAVPVGNGTTWQAKVLPNCVDTGGNHLNYTSSTNAFSCGTSGGGGSSNSFATVAPTSGTSPVASSSTDTLNLAAGTGITVTGNSGTKTVTFAVVNPLNQNTSGTAADLSATLSVAHGGTGTGSTLTGLVRGNASAMTAAELSGDVTTSGSNATTAKQLHLTQTAVVFSQSPYSVLSTDSTISCNATSGAIVLNLPAATGTGRVIRVKKTDSSANGCTLTRAGSDTIDGAATVALTAQYASSTIEDSGSGTWIRTHVNQLGGDATGASTALTVSATHLASPLPVAQGGSGAATLGANGVVIGQGTSAVHVTSAGTSGQFFGSNGAGVDPTWQNLPGGSFIEIFKASNENRNNQITLGDDSSLSYSVTTGHYKIRAFLIVGCSSSFGLSVTFNSTASVAFLSGLWRSSGMLLGAPSSESYIDTDNAPLSVTGSDTLFVELEASAIFTGSGTVSIQWAQAVSGATNTTVSKGSWLELQVMP
jgi:hypothetical protein